MPWLSRKHSSDTRPSLISHAMWNTWQGDTTAMLENCAASSHGGPPLSLETPTQPILQTSHWPSKGTPDKLAGAVSPAPNPPPPSQPPTSQSIGPMSINFILATIWMYLHLTPPSSPTKLAAQHISAPVTRYWRYPIPSQIPVAKSRKSCYRWTKAIIQ